MTDGKLTFRGATMGNLIRPSNARKNLNHQPDLKAAALRNKIRIVIQQCPNTNNDNALFDTKFSLLGKPSLRRRLEAYYSLIAPIRLPT
jgi:hypothetical protein